MIVKSTDTKVGVGKLGIATRDLLFAMRSAKEISKAISTALRKIPRSKCSSFFHCGGGMRLSVRFALADRPGLPPPTKKHRHKGRCGEAGYSPQAKISRQCSYKRA